MACCSLGLAIGARAAEARLAQGASGQGAPFAATLLRAESASAAQRWPDAAPLWQQVVEANPVNARFALQLALALFRSGQYRRAIPAWQRALELRAGFPAGMAYNIACSYALLGEKEPALQWLDRSFAMGFRNIEHARVDSDLVSLHDEPRFRALVGLVDAGSLSRDEGWRSDLALLSREVVRMGYGEGVYRALPRQEFEDSARALNERIPRLSDGQVLVEMMKLLRLAGDGHTGLNRPPLRPEWLLTLPLQFYLFQEGLFVVAADPRYRELLGAQVLRFGDRSVDEVMRALDPVISRDNDMWPRQVAPYRMRNLPLLNVLGVSADPRTIALTVVSRGAQPRTVTVEADGSQPDISHAVPAQWLTYSQALGTPLPLYLRNTASNYWFDYQPASRVLYFQFNQVLNDPAEPLAAFSERLFRFINEHDVSKFIIDLRWNNGGNTALIPPLLNRVIRSDKVDERGKLFVIIGRGTFPRPRTPPRSSSDTPTRPSSVSRRVRARTSSAKRCHFRCPIAAPW